MSPVRNAAPGPVLTASPVADRVIAVVFAATVVLFLLGLLALGG